MECIKAFRSMYICIKTFSIYVSELYIRYINNVLEQNEFILDLRKECIEAKRDILELSKMYQSLKRKVHQSCNDLKEFFKQTFPLKI